MKILAETREKIQARSGGRCERCGSPVETWHLHHRKPRRMGGRAPGHHVNTLSNMVILCPSCHAYVESHRQEALVDGFLLHENDVPEEVPVLLMRRRWVIVGKDYRTFESKPGPVVDTGLAVG